MSLVPVLLLAAVLQDPEAGVGRFVWPPTTGVPLHYRVRVSKAREVPPEIAKAARKARQEAELYAPRRSPKQHIDLEMAVQVHGSGQEVKGSYETRVVKHSLRMKLDESGEGDVPPLGNEPVAAIRAQVPRRVVPGAAASDAASTITAQPRSPITRHARIVLVPAILYPFPYVTQSIMKAKGVAFILAHRLRATAISYLSTHGDFTPVISRRRPSARRIFPFRLRQ